MDGADGTEEDAVLGHGVVNARRGEHALAQEAEGGDGDADGDQPAACRPERPLHDGGRWRGRGGQAVGAEDPQADDVHEHVDRHHADDAEHEAASQVAPRLPQLA